MWLSHFGDGVNLQRSQGDQVLSKSQAKGAGPSENFFMDTCLTQISRYLCPVLLPKHRAVKEMWMVASPVRLPQGAAPVTIHTGCCSHWNPC